MRSNRMLYAKDVAPYVPTSEGRASFLPFAQIPQPANYGLVAVCQFSLAERLRESGLACDREYGKLEGGWYRIAGIALPTARFAFVQEFEHHPGNVHLHLAIWRDNHIHRQDFFAARHLLSVPDRGVMLCDGPFLWR